MSLQALLWRCGAFLCVRTCGSVCSVLTSCRPLSRSPSRAPRTLAYPDAFTRASCTPSTRSKHASKRGRTFTTATGSLPPSALLPPPALPPNAFFICRRAAGAQPCLFTSPCSQTAPSPSTILICVSTSLRMRVSCLPGRVQVRGIQAYFSSLNCSLRNCCSSNELLDCLQVRGPL